jgi:transcriptional regulator with XRE-family HTH domain
MKPTKSLIKQPAKRSHPRRRSSRSQGSPAPLAGPAVEPQANNAQSLTRLSERVQRLRQQRDLSLEELAAASDVSASFLSQLERGLGNPSFLTLTKIARALSIPIGYLFGEEPSAANGIVRRNKRKRLIPPNGDLVYELITPDLNRPFEVVSIEIAPGQAEPDSPFLHSGEECLLVLEGEIAFHLGEELHHLGPGDSITFPGHLPHWANNPGKKNASLIVVIAPPAF